jgi:hypothetical protein
MLALASILASGSSRRRGGALLLAMAVLGVPFLWRPTSPLVAFVAALVALWGAIRVVDLYREHPARSWRMRLWHVLAIFDTRLAARVRPRVDAGAFGRGLLFCAIGAGGAAMVVYAAPRFDGTAHAAARWLGGVVLVYGLASGVAEWLRSIYLLIGVAVPPIHRSPLASRSLREFWGDRWNRVVGRWLREAIFLPLARRRRTAEGSTLAFVASALLHGYATTAAIGPAKAVPMIAFFLLHGVLVLIERALRVERWPDAWARLWFFAAMLLTLPLFLEPVLAIVLPASAQAQWQYG